MQSQLTQQSSVPSSPVLLVPSDNAVTDSNKEALKLDLVTIQEQTQHILMDKAEAENRFEVHQFIFRLVFFSDCACRPCYN